jgi:peptidoglycan hydrolase-like protein with peptidoglycan-binding domain
LSLSLLRPLFSGRLVGLALAAGLLGVPALVGVANPASAAAAPSTLQPGDHGKAVKALQKLLVKAGFRTATDGAYGRSTAATVRRFQRAANLKATGVVDAATLAALRSATSGRAAFNRGGGYDASSGAGSRQHLGDRIPLSRGMSGHDVKILQDFLNRAGFKVGVDGEFGAGTAKVVRAFEARQQVAVDGVVDASDIALLRSLPSGSARAAGAEPVAALAAPTAPGAVATVGADGLAVAPESAPEAVKQIIAAGNAIAKMPYVYGGGHGTWQDRGYDCSGSVSYTLHAAGLLDRALPSGDFTSWGSPGPGQWVTLYANGGHMYMVVAGLRFDTSGRVQDGSRWHASMRSSSGYTVVHPDGL